MPAHHISKYYDYDLNIFKLAHPINRYHNHDLKNEITTIEILNAPVRRVSCHYY
jgi:hypothetical protein